MKVTEIRREKLRALIEKHGAGNLATKLGYRQPSFLSQMAGPTPTRDVTEKTARKFERDLDLPNGYLDQPEDGTGAPAPRAASADVQRADIDLVADVIRMVGTICSGEAVELPTAKFADVVALAYVDTVEHDRTPRPEHIKQIVRLFK